MQKMKQTVKKIVSKIHNRYKKTRYYYPSLKLMFKIVKQFPKQKIVFIETTTGAMLNDSPIAIYNEWSKINKKIKFVFTYNGKLPAKYKTNAIAVKRSSPKYFYYAAVSKVWLNNQNFPRFLKPSKGTIYLQTWHGTPIKRMLNDIETIHEQPNDYHARVTEAIACWDYLLSPSPYATKCFATAFKHNAEVLELGYPRNDVFNNTSEEQKMQIKSDLNLPLDKKIILYAPTFRDNAPKFKNKFLHDPKIDFKRLEAQFGEEYIFILKLHPVAIMKNSAEICKSGFVKDMCNYNVINDLLLIADILITDYSSVMFDFLLMRKKTILYAYDLQDYEFNNRGFYLDYLTEAPGEVVQNENDLFQALDSKEISYDLDVFIKKYCPKDDGNASKRVIKFLEDKCNWKQ